MEYKIALYHKVQQRPYRHIPGCRNNAVLFKIIIVIIVYRVPLVQATGQLIVQSSGNELVLALTINTTEPNKKKKGH